MSIPYNDQWVLGRSRWRRRGRPVGGASGPGPHPLQRPPGDGREREDKGPARQPVASKAVSGAMRKRPRWIDRDT